MQSYNDWKNYALTGSTAAPEADGQETDPNDSSEHGEDPRIVRNLDPRVLKRATELLQPLLLKSNAPPVGKSTGQFSPYEKYRPIVDMDTSVEEDVSFNAFNVQFTPQSANTMTIEDAKRVIRGVLRSADQTAANLSAPFYDTINDQLEQRARRAALRVGYNADLLRQKEADLAAAKIAVAEAQAKVDELQQVVNTCRRAVDELAQTASSEDRQKAVDAMKEATRSIQKACRRLRRAKQVHHKAELSLQKQQQLKSNNPRIFSQVLSAAVQASDAADAAVKEAEELEKSGTATRSALQAANQKASEATARTADLSLRAAKLAAKMFEDDVDAIKKAGGQNSKGVKSRMNQEGELFMLQQHRNKMKRLSNDLAKWAAVKKASADEFAAKCEAGGKMELKETSEEEEVEEVESVAGAFDVDNLRSSRMVA